MGDFYDPADPEEGADYEYDGEYRIFRVETPRAHNLYKTKLTGWAERCGDPPAFYEELRYQLEEIITADRDYKLEYLGIRKEFDLEQMLLWTNFQERLTLGLALHAADLRRNLASFAKDLCLITNRDEDQNIFAFHISGCENDLSFGDRLIATNEVLKEKYCGSVKSVGLTEVVARMPQQFVLARVGQNLKISFDIRWTPYIIQENCLREARISLGGRVLFPTKIFNRGPLVQANVKTWKWHNPELNPIQRQAVVTVLEAKSRPVPFLISGPPGTGKTSTLVEYVNQIYKHLPDSKILICAPSNSAVNLLLKRLLKSSWIEYKPDIIRMTSESHIESGTLPKNLIHYFGKVPSENSPDGMQVIGSVEEMRQFRIVVTTVNYCGNFFRMGLKGHFSHLILDEAGQALETEILIPMCLMDRNNSHIVMFGDEKQLGPVVRYYPLQRMHFDLSSFERLSLMDIYFQEEGYLYTRLLNNYRSIPSILRYYNDLFYKESLIPMIKEGGGEEFDLVQKLSKLLPESAQRLAHKGVYFVNVETPCRKVPSTCSRYNHGEKERLVDFYELLLKNVLNKVPASEIGIVTPYTAQKQEIIAEIAARKLRQPKVGTVQIFQGEQRMVMLMSAVRSFDEGGCARNNIPLGFVSNPKRINVAISRARALLVIFGNKSVLSGCENWNKLIQMTIKDRTLIA